MRCSPLHLLAIVSIALASAQAFELPAHSVSTTQQFVVFAQDVTLRSRVAGFAEDNKRELLKILGTKDEWKTPILINFQRPDPSQPQLKASQVTLFDTGSGMKLQLDVQLGANPDDVALQSHLIEALLLEMAYRNRAPQHGEAYRRPPSWLIEGITERIRRRILGSSPQVFEALLAANRLPPLANFLNSAPNGPASTWTGVFRAGSLALLEQLVGLPHGQKSLRHLIDTIPESDGDQIARLRESFGSLGDSEEALEKWWSLSVAKMAAADRYMGSGVSETEARLQEILQLKIADPKGEPEQFELKDYAKFLRRDSARPALATMNNELIELSARGSALYRSIIGEYSQVAERLLRRKTRGLDEKLAELQKYRTAMLKRVDEIADYLNWMEGTQIQVRSQAFDGYFKVADELEAPPGRRHDPVTTYLDLVEKALPPPEVRQAIPAAVAQTR